MTHLSAPVGQTNSQERKVSQMTNKELIEEYEDTVAHVAASSTQKLVGHWDTMSVLIVDR